VTENDDAPVIAHLTELTSNPLLKARLSRAAKDAGDASFDGASAIKRFGDLLQQACQRRREIAEAVA
jgi:hypothetical protein